jgi:aspartyl-tRNA(Asn)/glutamyl-tRNA(Gln) amidotransferase subunit A
MVEESIVLTTIRQLSNRIKNGDLSPMDLVEACIGRIKRFNPSLDAFITVLEKCAYEDASIIEKQIKKGLYLGPLHGIPFSIKDIIYAKGVRCTAGSKIMSDYISKVDATCVTRMKKSGAILLGTNNLNEFASGITGVNPHYGSSKNPWDISKLSGGSSGGSAVAIATGMVPVSLATDTGGSIRVPSSLCGVVGLKPTYGRISRFGILDLAPSLDHVGCMTRSIWDAAAILQVIAGQDPLDPTTEDKKVPHYIKIIEREKEKISKRISVGVPKKYFFDYLQPEVERVFQGFIDIIKSINITVYNINIQGNDKIDESWRTIRLAEAAAIHSNWLKIRPEDYSEDVRRMLIQGMHIPAVDYLQALKFAKKARHEYMKVFKKVDVIIVPTTILTAPKLGETLVTIDDKNFQIRQALLRNNTLFNCTGLPVISIPAGLSKDNMPIGVQIIGAPYEEEKILSIAYAYESVDNSSKKFIPPLVC